MALVAVVTYQSLACGRFSRISISNKVLTPGETYSMRAERIVSDHLSNFWHLTSASSQSAKALPVTARPSNRQIDSAGPARAFTCHPDLLRIQETSWDCGSARAPGSTAPAVINHHPLPSGRVFDGHYLLVGGRGLRTGIHQTTHFLAEELPSLCLPVIVELHGLNAPLFSLPPSQLGGIASANHRSSLAAFGQISMTLSEPILDDSPSGADLRQ